IYSPEIKGRRIGEARAEWDVLFDLARRVRPELAEHLSYEDTHAVRREIASVVPLYAGIEGLREPGDSVQYGGPHLCAGWDFPTPDGKAHFSVVPLPAVKSADGSFLCSTRRGKQFNSMVHERIDALTGAAREAVLMNVHDATALGLRDGDPVTLRSDVGSYEGRVLCAPIQPGNVQVHWPEGSVLIDRHTRSPEAGIPDYNAMVRIEPG
ncbi:MAG: molybdopterin dinucleotide binding domain-containing protein, partial [bacterium]